ncbi:MAG: hypothetical protein ACR2JF_05015 [Iamia sp.]
MIDSTATFARLTDQRAAVDRRRDPHEHAVLAYRLGLAQAEAPGGDPAENQRLALHWYEIALSGFDPDFEPVAHARVLNAAAAATRSLGRLDAAASLFGRAAEMLAGHDRDDELAASLNNLGLARAGLGDTEGALDAFEHAVTTFSIAGHEGRRGRAAALVNLGVALASLGSTDGLKAAVDCYLEAMDVVGGDDAPYHCALADHARGVAEMALAERDEASAPTHLGRAVRAFEDSLGFFTRTGFPYQHSLAKHNLGRALAAVGGERDLLLGLVAVEDSVSVLDPRLHRTEWEHALHTLEQIESSLAPHQPARTRLELFMVLFEMSEPAERSALLTSRLTRLLALPRDARHSALRNLAAVSTASPADHGLVYIGTELTVLTELPNEHLREVLAARLEAHRRLPPTTRDDADRALDQAVGDALNGPQRVFVRDFLAECGFERP